MSLRTQKALAESLKKMLSQKTLDNITVSDVAEDCGLRRQTFYYHFHDIYELVEWIYFKEIEKAINTNKEYKNWCEGFYRLFCYLAENKAFVLNTYRSIDRLTLEKYVYQGAYYLLYAVVEEQAEGLHVKAENKKFIAEFYKYSFVGVMLAWIEGGMHEDPKKIVDNIELLICGSIKRALLKYNEEERKI